MFFSKNFIRANDKMCDFENWVPAPYFRKKFCLDFEPMHGEVTIH